MFKIGDIVSFLNETGEATIIQVESPTWVVVKDEFDFERKILASDLILKTKTSLEDDYKIDDESYIDHKEEKKSKKKRHLKRTHDLWEVDLHIEELVEDHSEMSNWEIIQIQLDKFERQLNEAINQKVRKIVFIHGVGEGVLREELRYKLKEYSNCTFHDANYRDYGYGATEVLINNYKI